MKITRGFSFFFICFPLNERANRVWGRERSGDWWTLCVGPMRFGFRPETILR